MSGNVPLVTRALWTWTTPVTGQAATPLSFPTVTGSASVTKSGLTSTDLANYMLIPLQYGNPPVPVPDSVSIGWIRYAEDQIETDTNIRLCQTWIAAPAATTVQQCGALNISPEFNYQQQGIDFDVREPGYDFFFERWRDEGWGYNRMRNRPVKSVDIFSPAASGSTNTAGVKEASFIYPLLNEFFAMPSTWVVEDQNRGLIRFVPSTSIQMLPLFAMQLAFMGFAESVPQGLWFQYTAGLTAADYASDWSFMKQLILAQAATTAFQALQTSINYGVLEQQTTADGLSMRLKYGEKGPFFAQITQQAGIIKNLTTRAKAKGGGFFMGYL